MNQRRVILAVVAVVAVGLVALWYWRGSGQDVAMTPTKGTTSLQDAFHGSATGAPVWPAPAQGTTSLPTAAEPAPEVAPPAVIPPVEPQSVDTPEPAQRKFARGGKPDDSEQN